MSQNQLSPDDPRLTAYALGELDPTEQEALEQLLFDSPQAQAAVREIRELAGLLATELRQEPALVLTAEQRAAILAAGYPAAVTAQEPLNHAANHADNMAGRLRSTDVPVPLSSLPSVQRRPNRSVKRFASLATIAALIVVVAIMIPPTRPQAEFPIGLVQDGRGLHELDDLGLSFAIANSERAGAVPDVSERAPMLASRGMSISNGTAEGMQFGERGEDRAGMDPVVAGQTAQLGDQSSVGGGDFTRPTGTGRRLAPSSNRPNVTRAERDKSGKLATTHHFYTDPKGLQERPGQGGYGGGEGRHSGESKAIVAKQLSAGVGGGAARPADADARTGPATPMRSLAKETAAQVSQGAGGKSSGNGKLARPAKELADNIENKPRPDSLGRSQPESEVDNLAGFRFAKPTRLYKKNLGEQKTDLYADQPQDSELASEAVGFEYRRLEQLQGLSEQGRTMYRRRLALGAEVYEPIVENRFFSSYEDPLSTFGVDVDTASYANVRRFLTSQQLPPPNAVRIEELVNYFSYDYPQPAAGQPFSVNVEAANCPWTPGHQLVRIALKGREIPRDQRPASNLVFLVDVSGSMQAENKLPLVKMGLNLLTQQMTESDRVAIVTYSDSAVQRLESTNGTDKKQIMQVIDSLQAAGSTNGAAGIQLAYRAALDHFIDGGTNRVILCTDGDFNVGVSDDDQLVQMIQERARTKVFFSVFGFGMGNLKDGKLEKLADKGNGHYAYVDGQREAHKMFVDELVATLVTIAKDVKLQVEFNPNQVGAYRLIGYENRVMASQDFNNDKKDAGDVGAGHAVTALYEIVPAGDAPRPELGEALRYRKAVVPQEGEVASELLTVKLRYKLPEADTSTLVEFPAATAGLRTAGVAGQPDGAAAWYSVQLQRTDADAAAKSLGVLFGNSKDGPAIESDAANGRLKFRGSAEQISQARKLLEDLGETASVPSREFNWAAAVAAFGMILRDSQFRGQANFDMVLELAQGAKGEDKAGHRTEFIELVKLARSLCQPVSPQAPADEPPAALSREQAEAKASLNGKFRNLLRIVPAAGDATIYGSFNDNGYWNGTSYLGHDNLPPGYWVYVAPNWYIWGDAK